MLSFDSTRESEYSEYLDILYKTAATKYPDCADIDAVVSETMLAFLVAIEKGNVIEHPKAFILGILRNQYNKYLREKYKNSIITYDTPEDMADDDIIDTRGEEYAYVRREIGRLIKIYRDVTVRYYVHGESVEQIAAALKIPKGTVLSRLASARSQIKEGLNEMEKYSQLSYEPKRVSLGIWGGSGLSGEPFSLVRSPIEANILVLAYEVPVSVRGIADAMGMPAAYIEPIVERLVAGELLGRTAGNLVYTRCFMQKYEDMFGDIPLQEALAKKNAEVIWKTAWKHIAPLTEREEFAVMSEKQKGTLLLFLMYQTISDVVISSKPKSENEPKEPLERPNGGRWLASARVLDNGQAQNNIYDVSGPAHINYSAENNGQFDCMMFDCQSVFGDAHWAYEKFKYRVSLRSIARFYASLLPCDVKTDNSLIYELVPEFEKLHIIRRDENGEIKLDIPAIPFDCTDIWNKMSRELKNDLHKLLGDELTGLWLSRKNHVPKHVDCREMYIHEGACKAYTLAQLLEIVKQGFLPYKVEVGKTPLIYVAYRRSEAKK